MIAILPEVDPAASSPTMTPTPANPSTTPAKRAGRNRSVRMNNAASRAVQRGVVELRIEARLELTSCSPHAISEKGATLPITA